MQPKVHDLEYQQVIFRHKYFQIVFDYFEYNFHFICSKLNTQCNGIIVVKPILLYLLTQVTLEEQMICGALQTLNEEAFEDVVASERPSPTGGPSTGETIDSNMHLQTHGGSVQQSQQMLTPIQETVEHERSLANLYITATKDRLQSHTLCPTPNTNNNKNFNNNNNQYNKNINLKNNNNNNSNVCTIGKGNNIKLNISPNMNQMHDQSPLKQHPNVSVPLTTRLSSYPSSTLGSFTSLSGTDHKEPNTISSSSSPSSTVILMPMSVSIDPNSHIDDTRL